MIENLQALHWLWAVLVLAVVLVIGLARRQRALRRLASVRLLARLLPHDSPVRRWVRAGLVVLALVLLVGAMIDPRWGVSYQEVRQRGIDLMIVLDVSRSMLAEDARPNRLERARVFIREMLDSARGDRVGLVTFAGIASVKCPLTVDHAALRLALDTVTVETEARGGSLLGDALRLAGDSFTDEIPDHKAIVVFTDGEDHGSYPVEAAQRLHEELSIPVFTVGLGDADEGARIPVEGEGGSQTWLLYKGQEVWSKMDAALLRDVALASGGAFVPVGTGTFDMTRLYEDRIGPIAQREFEATVRKQHQPRFHWFAGLALLLLLVESFLGEGRKTRVVPPVVETPS